MFRIFRFLILFILSSVVNKLTIAPDAGEERCDCPSCPSVLKIIESNPVKKRTHTNCDAVAGFISTSVTIVLGWRVLFP